MTQETQTAGAVVAGMSDGVSMAFLSGITNNAIPATSTAQPAATQAADPAQQPAATQQQATTQQQPAAQQQANTQAPVAQQTQQPAATQQQTTTQQPAATQQQAANTPAAAPQEIDFGFGKIVLNNQAPVVPTTYEDLFKSESVRNVFGIQEELTPEVLHQKVLPAVAEARKNAAEVGRVKSELESFKGSLASMPAPLAQAVTAYLAKPDSNEWMSAMKANEVTLFTKHVSQIPAPDLVKNMLDIEVTPEMVSDPSDTNTQKLVAKATEIYNEKKAQKDAAIQAQITTAQQRKHDYSAAISTSAQSVPQYLPVQVDPAQVTQATTLLSQGPNGIMSLFFDERGVPKPDAVANIILVSDGNGKKMVDTLTKMVLPQVQSKVHEQIVERGIATQSGGTSAGEQVKLTPEQVNKLNALNQFGLV